MNKLRIQAMNVDMDSTNSLLGDAKMHVARVCFVRPARELDPASRGALCDYLKTSLATVGSASTGYPWLAHETYEACTEKQEGWHSQ
jgi:hypothetical protein